MKRHRAFDTYRVSRDGSKEPAQPRQELARDSASDSSKLLTSESMLEVEGDDADDEEQEGVDAEEEAEEEEEEWCSTWCIWERVCMAVMIWALVTSS